MSPQQAAEQQSQSFQCPIDQAMQRLLETSEMIQYRARIRPTDMKRVVDALILSRESDPPNITRERNYWEFMRSIARDCGNEMVGLCALGLGRSTIGNMKSRYRLELSRKIKNNQTQLDCPVLRDTLQSTPANQHPATPRHASPEQIHRLRIGDIYKVSMDQLQAIVNSDQVEGTPTLQDPDDVHMQSWISFNITNELKSQLVLQCQPLV